MNSHFVEKETETHYIIGQNHKPNPQQGQYLIIHLNIIENTLDLDFGYLSLKRQ